MTRLWPDTLKYLICVHSPHQQFYLQNDYRNFSQIAEKHPHNEAESINQSMTEQTANEAFNQPAYQ
jgi:hypothetical protein